jgi:hypothetical protein
MYVYTFIYFNIQVNISSIFYCQYNQYKNHNLAIKANDSNMYVHIYIYGTVYILHVTFDRDGHITVHKPLRNVVLYNNII